MKETLQKRVLEIIHDHWPVHVSEVITLLKEDPKNITNVSKIRYHFNTLERKEKIRLKKIGKALVAWPMHMERVRIANEFLEEAE